MSRCAICGDSTTVTLYELPNGSLLRCGRCGTVRRANLVGGGAAEALYDDDSYLDTPYFEVLERGASRDQEPYVVYRRVLDRLEADGGRGTLLDLGCSFGAFLELAAERGWKPLGVELSAKACEYAREERGLEVVHGRLEEARLPESSIRAATLWDVIEHLEDPLETLRELYRVLEPGGTVVLFTINQRSLINRVGDALYKVTAGRWTRPMVLLYDIHHNYFFDPVTVRRALRSAGFADLSIEWMEAKIERWQNVPIPRLLVLGTKVLDWVSRILGERYRMIVHARKPAGESERRA